MVVLSPQCTLESLVGCPLAIACPTCECTGAIASLADIAPGPGPSGLVGIQATFGYLWSVSLWRTQLTTLCPFWTGYVRPPHLGGPHIAQIAAPTASSHAQDSMTTFSGIPALLTLSFLVRKPSTSLSRLLQPWDGRLTLNNTLPGTAMIQGGRMKDPPFCGSFKLP